VSKSFKKCLGIVVYAQHIRGWLFRWKASGLIAEQQAKCVGPSALLGPAAGHLAGKGIIRPVKQLVLDLIPAPLPTFNNFVPGRNTEALQASKDAALGAAAAKVVYLWGIAGSGKSHLAQAVGALPANRLLKPADINDLQPGINCHALDDVQTFNDAQQIALFNLINLHNQPGSRSSVLVTGNVAPRDLPLRPELTSRLGSGLVFQMHPLSDAEKADALRAHARARSFTLRDDVNAYLLRHARRDMASLISILDALDRHSLETGREITLPMLREMAQPSLQ
jgi:DnaA-homolog protein